MIVPGWEPDVDVADLRVQTDSGEWLSVDSALAGTLFNGTPVMVLGLDAGVPGEGETIQGVGVADAGEVVPHDLDGVHAVDLDLDL